MDKIKDYFNQLQKYFGTNETLHYNIISTEEINIVSNISNSSLIKLLKTNKDLFELNLQKAIINLNPNIDPMKINIYYEPYRIIVKFKRDTYLDILPEELIIIITSYIMIPPGSYFISQKVRNKTNMTPYSMPPSHVVRLVQEVLRIKINNFYNKIIGQLVPDLYKYIMPKNQLTENEYDDIINFIEKLDRPIINLFYDQHLDVYIINQEFYDKWKNKTLRDFLMDTSIDVIDYPGVYVNLVTYGFILLIKMYQHYPYFAKIHTDISSVKRLYELLYNYSIYDVKDVDNYLNFMNIIIPYLKTGILSKHITNVESIINVSSSNNSYKLHFAYDLLNDPNFKFENYDAYIKLVSTLVYDGKLLEEYLKRLNKDDIQKIIRYIIDNVKPDGSKTISTMRLLAYLLSHPR